MVRQCFISVKYGEGALNNHKSKKNLFILFILVQSNKLRKNTIVSETIVFN